MEPDSNRSCSGSDNRQDLQRYSKRLNQKGAPQFKVLRFKMLAGAGGTASDGKTLFAR